VLDGLARQLVEAGQQRPCSCAILPSGPPRQWPPGQTATALRPTGTGLHERRLTCELQLAELSNQAAVRNICFAMGNRLDMLATSVDVLAEIERVGQGELATIRLLIELL